MKRILIVSLVLMCSSCLIRKGHRLNGQCRAKNPNFKLVKVPFVSTSQLIFNKAYVADDATKSRGYGFYPDGRLIYIYSKNGFALKAEDVEDKVWKTAQAIGYWRIDGSKVKTEYFSCSNSGDYIKKEGMIRGDTIFFERDCGSNVFKREKCFDKYIASDMSFR